MTANEQGALMTSHTDGLIKGQYRILPMQEILFGPGSLAGLAAETDRLGIRRARIITSNTLATRTGLVQKVQAALGERCAGVFHKTVPHIPRSVVFAAAEMATRGAVRRLIAGLGLSQRIRELGVPEDDLPSLAAAVMKDYQAANNPRPITQDAMLELLRRMY